VLISKLLIANFVPLPPAKTSPLIALNRPIQFYF
jgi:hypothetical protein